MSKLYVGPRDGEFGKSWTRVIGRAIYYFELRKSPAGRRLMVMRCTTGTYGTRSIVHWLYDCDPDAYEAQTRTQNPAETDAQPRSRSRRARSTPN